LPPRQACRSRWQAKNPSLRPSPGNVPEPGLWSWPFSCAHLSAQNQEFPANALRCPGRGEAAHQRRVMGKQGAFKRLALLVAGPADLVIADIIAARDQELLQRIAR